MVLHINSPFIDSMSISDIAGHPVWLKMDALQPTGSFKIRGVGLMCQRAFDRGEKHFVCSSGGNAGHAVAFAGRKLGARVTVIVPETTPEFMRKKIAAQGAEVRVEGSVWDEADQVARALAAEPGCCYAPPFDHPDLWEGHSTLVDELVAVGHKPGSIVVAVGGGGLFCGVVEGLQRVGWGDVPVFAVETEGAASFAAAKEAGELVTIPGITSIAKSLGARRVCQKAVEWAKSYPVTSLQVTDRQALDACLKFCDDHRILVEPACGAALAAVYEKSFEAVGESTVVVVCGGAAVTRAQLETWDQMVEKAQ